MKAIEYQACARQRSHATRVVIIMIATVFQHAVIWRLAPISRLNLLCFVNISRQDNKTKRNKR